MKALKSVLNFIVVVLLLFSCRNGNEEKSVNEESSAITEEKDTTGSNVQLETYTSRKNYFSTKYPTSLKIYEGKLPAEAPVVNIYDPQNQKQPPFAIHEEASASYIAFLPEGFGVDGPGGERKSVAEWQGHLPLNFSYDVHESQVYLLENGKPWGLSIRFSETPPGWKEVGSIFVHYSVKNFQSECYNKETGNLVPMEECDPLMGDRTRFKGEVSEESREQLNTVLRNLEFHSNKEKEQGISELIRLEQPKENEELSSPFTIKGEARGYWFFEGVAPYKLLSASDSILARGTVEAKGEWMTEDFVAFEGKVSFETPKEKRGYLIMSRANASGKPEKDRSLQIPVRFE